MGPSGWAELSANTRRAYRTGQRNWRSWASAQGVPEFPARPGDLQQWLAALAGQDKRPATLQHTTGRDRSQPIRGPASSRHR